MIAKSAVQRESEALSLNLFCAAIFYTEFIFLLWLLSGENRTDLDRDPMLFNKRIKGASTTCSSSYQCVLNYLSFQ